jgi:hypothetical protein
MNTLRVGCSLKILCTYEVCFTCKAVFNAYNSHIWVWDNPYAIRARGCWVSFSAKVSTGIVRSTAVGSCCYLTGWLVLDGMLWRRFCWCCLKMRLQLWGRFVVSEQWSACTLVGNVHQWSNTSYPGRQPTALPLLFAGSNLFDFITGRGTWWDTTM